MSKPTSEGTGGMTGWPFSKKSMGDFSGSNFEGAHHLLKQAKKIKLSIYKINENLIDDEFEGENLIKWGRRSRKKVNWANIRY